MRDYGNQKQYMMYVWPKKERKAIKEADSRCGGGPENNGYQEVEDGFFALCKMKNNHL